MAELGNGGRSVRAKAGSATTLPAAPPSRDSLGGEPGNPREHELERFVDRAQVGHYGMRPGRTGGGVGFCVVSVSVSSGSTGAT